MSEININDELAKNLHKMVEIVETSTDLEGTALVTKTGLRVASSSHAGVHIDHHSASPAMIVSLGEKVSMGLEYGEMSQCVVSGEEGYTIITTKRDSEFMLLSHSKQASKLGYYFHRLKKAFEKITELLQGIEIGEASY